MVKPFGTPSQPDDSGDLSVLDWARHNHGGLHLLHRLDRPTGGLVLLAKTKSAAAAMSRAFQEGRVRKTYFAVTDRSPDPESGELHHFIGKLPGKNFVRAYDKPVRNSKEARLTYRVSGERAALSLLEIRPSTGRRHQIRAQLKRLGLSILGDKKYGRTKALDYPGIALWAQKLEFLHPSTEVETVIRAPLPEVWPWMDFGLG